MILLSRKYFMFLRAIFKETQQRTSLRWQFSRSPPVTRFSCGLGAARWPSRAWECAEPLSFGAVWVGEEDSGRAHGEGKPTMRFWPPTQTVAHSDRWKASEHDPCTPSVFPTSCSFFSFDVLAAHGARRETPRGCARAAAARRRLVQGWRSSASHGRPAAPWSFAFLLTPHGPQHSCFSDSQTRVSLLFCPSSFSGNPDLNAALSHCSSGHDSFFFRRAPGVREFSQLVHFFVLRM